MPPNDTKTPVILQVDFPFSGPFGRKMSEQMEGLARDIATETGFVWKIWTENEAEKRAGGIYLFDNFSDADRYRKMHTARLQGFGIEGIEARIFAVNMPLSAIDRAPLD